MTLAEAVRRDPRLLALRSIEELQISLERNTRNVPQDGQFHVRVRGRIIFSGSYAAAQARFDRARDAQLCRKLSELRRRSERPFQLRAVQTVRSDSNVVSPYLTRTAAVARSARCRPLASLRTRGRPDPGCWR